MHVFPHVPAEPPACCLMDCLLLGWSCFSLLWWINTLLLLYTISIAQLTYISRILKKGTDSLALKVSLGVARENCVFIFQALIGAYDAVARREFEPNSELVPGLSYLGENPAATFRYIGIRKPTKSPDDHLGISVREENGQLVVARVIEESPISKQGLLHPGDTILEVNGKEVKDAEQLKEAFKAASNGIIIKVIPAPIDLPPNTQVKIIIGKKKESRFEQECIKT